ncbi:MAG: ATP-binding cassette domain-containing protein [Spirochaetaceae bacterium]|nr:ATP-binding cassette domain-containing protein [Spirochaetaceae bacterium]
MMTLEVKNLEKKYPKKNVLNNVSLKFDTGSIYAILGENGAGKSTLVSILSGSKKANKGTITVNNTTYQNGFNNVNEAIKNKIRITHQHPILDDEITVLENCLISNPRKNIKEKIIKIFDNWNFEIDVNKKCKNLNANERFYTELLAVLISNPNFLILDEPTVFLSEDERKKLYSAIKKNSNNSINKLCTILITHKIEEAKNLCDKIIYIKKGNLSKNFSFNENTFEINKEKKLTEEIFKIENLFSESKYLPKLFNINLSAKKNSITCITGKREDGLETLEEIISGIEHIEFSGNIKINNYQFSRIINIFELRKLSIGIIPSNRITRGANQNLTIEEFFFPYDKNKMIEIINKAKIRCELSDKIKTLSGGMLQRIILERELSLNSDILFLFEPDQGLDTEARNILSEKILNANKNGTTIIIFTSSDENELIKISDKVIKIKEGKII